MTEKRSIGLTQKGKDLLDSYQTRGFTEIGAAEQVKYNILLDLEIEAGGSTVPETRITYASEKAIVGRRLKRHPRLVDIYSRTLAGLKRDGFIRIETRE